jgi:hypothetical protein
MLICVGMYSRGVFLSAFWGPRGARTQAERSRQPDVEWMTISRAYGTWSNGTQQRTLGKDHWTGRFAASKKEVTSFCRSRQKLVKDHLHDGWVQRFSVEEEWVGAVAGGAFPVDQVSHERVHIVGWNFLCSHHSR